jgi:glycosyltransferase involved in cell wall biosynthesis
MEICMFGKYPPIEGGVSMRTYWGAHGLARLGHTVHVITNAKEVELPYRMFMRDEDWRLCEGQYGPGSVKVHWTESYGKRQWHIPTSRTFITKLTSLGLELAQMRSIDVLYAHYVEPYGVAAHIVSEAMGLPLVIRPAGSDAGRLWALPQFRVLYNHVFTSADTVICGPTVAQKMIDAGVEPARIARSPDRYVSLPDLFAPTGSILNIELLRNQILIAGDQECQALLFGQYDPSLSYFGIYGKLGKAKGTQSLLAAFTRLRDRGFPVGLLVMAHDRPGALDAFRECVKANRLEKQVCQLPFLPHWRVPEFIRRCTAVCCLEQDFPIKFHNSVLGLEVLTCGGCLIGSVEATQKLPEAHRLIDGDNCIVVQDVSKIDDVERQLVFVIENPERVEQIRRRARQYAVDIHLDNTFPHRLESILIDTAKRKRRGNC